MQHIPGSTQGQADLGSLSWVGPTPAQGRGWSQVDFKVPLNTSYSVIP